MLIRSIKLIGNQYIVKIKFINALVLNLDEKPFLSKKQVLVDGKTIVSISEKISTVADRVIDVKENILMGGFANAHAHNAMTLFRGFKSEVDFQSWLFDYIIPLEKKLSGEDVFWSEMLGIAEGLASGVTAFEECYFHLSYVLKAIKKAKVRARVGIEIMQGRESAFDLNEKIKLFDKNDDLIKPIVYPHSIYSLSENELSEAITFAAKNNLPISTHLSETLEEVGKCAVANNGKSPVAYLEDLGFFDRDATLYHCVHLDKFDAQILQKYNVNIVTCPSSNLKLANGIAPLSMFLNNDINVAIGTDGAASNDSVDMFKEMFLTSNLQKAILYDPQVMKINEVLKMATENGYRALNFEKCGKIKQGYNADLILVDVQGIHHQPQNDLLSNLIYSAKSTDVYLTMVNGKILYENGKFDIGENIETIISKCKEIKNRLQVK